MNKVTDLMLLPRASDGWLMGEECCWQRKSPWTPFLPLIAASAWGIPIEPWDVDGDQQAAADLNHTMVFSASFADELEASLARIPHASLIPNPACAFEHLARRIPHHSTVLPNAFYRDTPLDLSLIPDDLWPTFTHILYQVSTGCPWHCPFCVWQNSLHKRPPALCVREIDALLERVPAAAADTSGNSISILANELSGRPRWLAEFAAGMHDLHVAWRTDLNIRNTTERTIATLACAGCRHVTLGVEFLTTSMLHTLGKGHDIEDALLVMAMLQAAGIGYHFSLRQGVGETVADLTEMGDNLQFFAAEGIRPEWVHVGHMIQWQGQTWLGDTPKRNIGTEAWPRHTAILAPDIHAAWQKIVGLLATLGWAKAQRDA